MKTIWYALLVAGILLSGCIVGCSQGGDEGGEPIPSTPTPRYAHYVNEEFEFSLDYPEDWLLEELNPYEVGIKPGDSKHNQIQIGAYSGKPQTVVLEESQLAATHQASLQNYFDTWGASDFEILVNEPASGQWDWEVRFSAIYETTPLKGGHLVHERYISEDENLTYSIFYMYSKEWLEGLKVINSFKID